jgi:hypothetical protein
MGLTPTNPGGQSIELDWRNGGFHPTLGPFASTSLDQLLYRISFVARPPAFGSETGAQPLILRARASGSTVGEARLGSASGAPKFDMHRPPWSRELRLYYGPRWSVRLQAGPIPPGIFSYQTSGALDAVLVSIRILA